MRTFVLTVTFLVMAALVVGCSERNMPTEASQVLPGPAFDFTNGPSELHTTRLFLLRFKSHFGYYAIDFENQLLAFHSTDNADQFCGQAVTAYDLADRQGVFNPADETLIMDLLLASEHFVKVYDWAGLMPDPIDCTYLDLNLLAEGTARFQLTDNDFLAFLRTEPLRANAAGFTSEGTLNLTGGGQTHYNAAQRVVFFPPDNVPEFTGKINLTPDPRY